MESFYLGYDDATAGLDSTIEFPDDKDYMRGFRAGIVATIDWAQNRLRGFDRDFPGHEEKTND